MTQVLREGQGWDVGGGFDLKLIDDDGKVARMFTPDGRGEIDIIAPPVSGPVPPEAERSDTVIPISFPTLEQARRAGQILADAFEAVRAIEREEPPAQGECEHENSEPRFFGRQLRKVRICERCAAHLGALELKNGEWVEVA